MLEEDDDIFAEVHQVEDASIQQGFQDGVKWVLQLLWVELVGLASMGREQRAFVLVKGCWLAGGITSLACPSHCCAALGTMLLRHLHPTRPADSSKSFTCSTLLPHGPGRDGMVSGITEGRELGLQKGYEIGAWAGSVRPCSHDEVCLLHSCH